MNEDAVWIGLTTFPSLDLGRSIGTTLVFERLAACCNLVPQVESIYRWEGAIETSSEVLGILKFRAADEPALRARLLELHPYEVAEWIAWPLEAGSAKYLDWVRRPGA